jgi:hypothetical protein
MPSTHRFVAYTDLLSQDQIDRVSGVAARLFTHIWNRCAFADDIAIVMENADAVRRLHIKAHRLKSAQDELVKAGWLTLERYSEDHTRYTLSPD